MPEIPDFEDLFEEQILERAMDYCDDEIIDIISISSTEIRAMVWGSYKYRVHIKLEEDRITEMSCSCPYEWGNCKHMAALLMYVEQMDEELNSDQSFEEVENIEDDSSIHQILESSSKSDLIRFIKMQAEDDESIIYKARIFLTSDEQKLTEDYKKLVSDFLKQYPGSEYEFVDWRYLPEIHQYFLDLICSFQSAGKFTELIELSFEIIRQINQCLVHTDDSNGDLTGLLEEVFRILYEIISDPKFTGDQRILLFEKLMALLDEPQIYFWDCGYYCWDLAANLVMDKQDLDLLTKKMNEAEIGGGEFSIGFRKQRIASITLSALKNMGNEKAAREFMVQNNEYPEIRKQLVEQCMESGQFEEAKILIAEGIRLVKELGHRGTVSDWEKMYLQIAQEENNEEEMIHWARQNLIHHFFDLENFRLLKTLTPASSWNEERQNIIQNLKEKGPFVDQLNLMQIYAEERMLNCMRQ